MLQSTAYFPAPPAVHAPFQSPANDMLAGARGFPTMGAPHPSYPQGYYQPVPTAPVPGAGAPPPQRSGYDEGPPASESMAWNELTEEEQAAAEALGYTHAMWDHDVKLPFEHQDWARLSPLQREYLKVLGWTPPSWDYHNKAHQQHQMQAQQQQQARRVEHTRVYIEKMVPQQPGGRALSYPPPHMEHNITLGPCGHLQPQLGMQKVWYNTRIYVPEKPRRAEDMPRFLDRYEETDHHVFPGLPQDPAADGGGTKMWTGDLYIDKVKVQQRAQFWQKQVEDHQKKMEEDALAKAGVGIQLNGHWFDAYTGDGIVESGGRLFNTREFMAKHGVQASDWQKLEGAVFGGWDFANLRIPTAFDDRTESNKMVMPAMYAFDRRSATYRGDSAFEVEQLEHAYWSEPR